MKGLDVENFENWNKNVRKKNLSDNSNSNENTNLNQRDYDKEPLILRDYSRAMFIHNIFNLIFSLVSLFTFSLLDSHMEFSEIIRTIFIWFFIFIAMLLISYIIFIRSKEHYVTLSFMKAVFYDDNLQPYKIHRLLGDKEFYSAMYALLALKWFICPMLIVFGILVLFDVETSFLQFILFITFFFFVIILYDILFRMLVYKKSNKNLTNFWKYSQKFQIEIGWEQGIRGSVHNGVRIFFFNQKDHDLLREYFFSTFHFDLDKDIKGIKRIY